MQVITGQKGGGCIRGPAGSGHDRPIHNNPTPRLDAVFTFSGLFVLLGQRILVPGVLMELFTFIGEKIRELRAARKLSQEQLGREMGVPTNTISRWETATYRPKIEDLDGLSRFFG